MTELVQCQPLPTVWVAGTCVRRTCRRPFVVPMAGAIHPEDGWPSTCSSTCANKHRLHRRRQEHAAQRTRVQARERACTACGEAAGTCAGRLLCRQCWHAVEASCRGKQRHGPAAAKSIVERMARLEPGVRRDAYWCPLSEAWHIGGRVAASRVARIRAATQVLLAVLAPEDLAALLATWDPAVIGRDPALG